MPSTYITTEENHHASTNYSFSLYPESQTPKDKMEDIYPIELRYKYELLDNIGTNTTGKYFITTGECVQVKQTENWTPVEHTFNK